MQDLRSRERCKTIAQKFNAYKQRFRKAVIRGDLVQQFSADWRVSTNRVFQQIIALKKYQPVLETLPFLKAF